jgi:uncharacterized lipoprotein YddW (UPF0748 family)
MSWIATSPSRALCAVVFASLLVQACTAAPRDVEPSPSSTAPPIAREFRGVWVATVGNIDWPSAPGLPVEQQKSELIAIMDRAVELRLNSIVFQIRTAADALYASQLEPWSEYLTGRQGQPPSPLYDPLAFAIDAAHARGLELHAWFNPYRARHPSTRSELAPSHIAVTRPDIVRRYGTHLWMDPGEPDVQDHTVSVMLDVVRRYDVDGIHIDDYFYPYREQDSARVEIPFPDEPSWNRYVAAGGSMTRSDWRRDNVDQLVRRLHGEIHDVKPWVKFGVSPIGIWRPGPAPEACCFDAYESIFADARKWLAEGWVDYFVPQLYRTMSDTLMNYGVMLGWWAEQNHHDRHVYIGMIPNRVRTVDRPDGWPPEEIVGQIYVARGHPGAHGHVHFSARSLMRPDSLVAHLKRTVYRTPALVPPSHWLETAQPSAPRATLSFGATASTATVTLEAPPANEHIRLWAVRVRYGDRWTTQVVPVARTRIELSGPAPIREVVVSAVDRSGNEGVPHVLRVAGAAGGG